jgi:hypothetical protein
MTTLLGAGLLWMGCGGGSGTPDMPPDMTPDMGDPWATVPAVRTGAGPASIGCFGAQPAPSGGSDVTFDLPVREFQSMQGAEGLCVKIFADNTPTNDPCDVSDPTTDSSGNVSLTLPAGSWYAYRVFARPDPDMMMRPAFTYLDSVQRNFPVPPDAVTVSPAASSVVQSTVNVLLGFLGLQVAPGTAILAGTVFDCAGVPLEGTRIRIFRADGAEILPSAPPMGVAFRYFDGSGFPMGSRRETNIDGLYAVANVPVLGDGESLFVETWGKRTDMGAPELLSCETIVLHANGVSIVDQRGLRTDGPACPSL